MCQRYLLLSVHRTSDNAKWLRTVWCTVMLSSATTEDSLQLSRFRAVTHSPAFQSTRRFHWYLNLRLRIGFSFGVNLISTPKNKLPRCYVTGNDVRSAMAMASPFPAAVGSCHFLTGGCRCRCSHLRFSSLLNCTLRFPHYFCAPNVQWRAKRIKCDAAEGTWGTEGSGLFQCNVPASSWKSRERPRCLIIVGLSSETQPCRI